MRSDLVAELIRAGDSSVGAIQTLRTHPSAVHAERVACILWEMYLVACLLRGDLHRAEGRHDGQ